MAKAGALGRTAAMAANALTRVRAWMTGRPRTACRIVHTFHGHVLDGYFSASVSRLFVMIERWLARRTDSLVAVSQAIRDDLLKKGIGQPEQWRIIPLGLISPLSPNCRRHMAHHDCGSGWWGGWSRLRIRACL